MKADSKRAGAVIDTMAVAGAMLVANSGQEKRPSPPKREEGPYPRIQGLNYRSGRAVVLVPDRADTICLREAKVDYLLLLAPYIGDGAT